MAEAFYTGAKPISAEDVQTVQFDARFPNCNQTKHCWQSYVDFHRCLKLKGETYQPCKQFFKAYSSLCPVEWVEKWDEQREAGTFAYKEKL